MSEKFVYYYECPTCKSKDTKIKDQFTTEAYYKLFRDASGFEHDHDYNEGTVLVKCVNGHEFEQEYVAYCSCGWTSKS